MHKSEITKLKGISLKNFKELVERLWKLRKITIINI